MPYLERCLNRGIAEEIFRPDINKRNTGWLYCWQIQNALEGDTSREDVNKIIENVNDLFFAWHSQFERNETVKYE